MARMPSEVVVRSELRPCEVKYESDSGNAKFPGLFHQWASMMDSSGATKTMGVVENAETGEVKLVFPTLIKFADNRGDDYFFPERDNTMHISDLDDDENALF